MSTKEIQEQLAKNMKKWQKIEDASMASTGKIMEQTDHPLLHLIMEIIQVDSQVHRRVQGFIADSLEKERIHLTPEQMGEIWKSVENHIALERKMIGFVEEALAALKGKKMVVQEYLLNYLREDEQKHDHLLDALDKIKNGMYPYG